MATTNGRDVNWLAIRTYYFSSPTVSYRQCAERFNVSTRNVERVASKEGWVAKRRQNVGDAQGKLQKASAADTLSALTVHAELADDLAQAVRKQLNEIDEMKPGRTKAETLRALADVADKSIRLGREVRGIRPGEASVVDEEGDDDSAVRIVREIVELPVAADRA